MPKNAAKQAVNIDYTDLKTIIVIVLTVIIVGLIIYILFSKDGTNSDIANTCKTIVNEAKSNRSFLSLLFGSTPAKTHNKRFASAGEQFACEAFEEYLDREVDVGVRPNFLRNEETKRNLEYDCYDKITKVAVEYNGEQHYMYVPNYHRSYQEYIKQVRHDVLKQELSKQHGVRLLVVPYTAGTVGSRYPNVEERRDMIRRYVHDELNKIYRS
jgi:hypothetical protein